MKSLSLQQIEDKIYPLEIAWADRESRNFANPQVIVDELNRLYALRGQITGQAPKVISVNDPTQAQAIANAANEGAAATQSYIDQINNPPSTAPVNVVDGGTAPAGYDASSISTNPQNRPISYINPADYGAGTEDVSANAIRFNQALESLYGTGPISVEQRFDPFAGTVIPTDGGGTKRYATGLLDVPTTDASRYKVGGGEMGSVYTGDMDTGATGGARTKASADAPEGTRGKGAFNVFSDLIFGDPSGAYNAAAEAAIRSGDKAAATQLEMYNIGRGDIIDASNRAARILTGLDPAVKRTIDVGALQTALPAIEAGLRSREQLASGAQQGLDTLGRSAGYELGAQREGYGRAAELLDPAYSAGSRGLEAFADSALNPNSAVLRRGLSEQERAIDRGLAARGLLRSGPGLEMQKEAAQELIEKDMEKQIGRQQALANMGLQTGGQLANIFTGQAGAEADIARRLGQGTSNIQMGLSGDIARQNVGVGDALSQAFAQRGTAQNLRLSQLGSNLANIATRQGGATGSAAMQTGSSLGNIYLGQGQARADAITGAQNTRNQQMQGLLNLGGSIGSAFIGKPA